MFAALQENMSPENYTAFINDYQLLYNNKLCGQWKQLHKFKKDGNIFAKDIFKELHDKYNYLAYKQIAKNNKQVHALLQALLNTKGIYAAFIVELHYLTEIYISFMIEYVFKQELQKQSNIKIVSNDYLDIVKKIDIVMNDKPIQIKNYSFISCNETTTDRLKEYKNIKELSFIFYTLEKDNICFMEIDNKVLLPIESIDSFTALLPTKEITLAQTIAAVRLEERI
ncbi:hypothetical protein [Butyrivibrio sp. INlla16]|uniref:hypothetical protein n=1 Tax=Butyrivibrio sp. INlla16 TaxID=1520807 RepID=UPI00088CFA82|nr:hypothetical protein [Butyrivibrio sp. INlla16]SDB69825.1 hypothetical protein SAMN02910263_04538 [Butyrivibrio sp. INlla16]